MPQFGDWDQKGGGGAMPDYSMDFTKIREMRKQNKRDPSLASFGNEEELIKPTESSAPIAKLTTVHSENQRHFSPDRHHQPHSPSVSFQTIFCVFDLIVTRCVLYIYLRILLKVFEGTFKLLNIVLLISLSFDYD